MGNFVTRAGMSQELFRAAYAFIGHLRGGLAMATIVRLRRLRRHLRLLDRHRRHHGQGRLPVDEASSATRTALSTGAIAAGGTLGILIPPSTIMVIYGIMTETNIGKLFAAGILPGILATFLLCLAVQWITWRDPAAGPRGERSSWRERLRALKDVWAVAAALRPGDGRHLRRRLHRHRRRRHRRLRRAAASRWRAARSTWRTLLRRAGRERAHHGDAVHDPDRRADVRRVRQLHDDAGRPEELRHRARPVARSWWWRRSA